MLESQIQQSMSNYQNEEKHKKMFMKLALTSLRKYFNNKEIPFHPILTCVSIKPGCSNRCASLQSYPNQSVWKSLTELPIDMQLEVADFLTQELVTKKQKFSPPFLIEVVKRIQNKFDFTSFYREPSNTDQQPNNIQTDSQNSQFNAQNGEVMNVKLKKWSKGADFVSESQQIATHMKLCNQHPPLVKINQCHYHKLRSLLEKIREQKYTWSNEMKLFVQELEKFLQNDPQIYEIKAKKKLKKSNDKKEKQQMEDKSIQRQKILQTEIKVEENTAQDFLEQFKMKVKQIEPGIVMFLPQYSKIDPLYHQYYKNLEEEYFRNLYYKVRAEDMDLNPQNILKTLNQVFQKFNNMIPYKVEHDFTLQ